MKTINWACAVAASAVLAAGLVTEAGAQSTAVCTLTVTGQNNSAVDVGAVSAAVNSPVASGDVTVCLAGVFDFGVAAFPTVTSVSISPNPAVTSLLIIGVNDPVTGRLATIRRGVQALTLAPSTLLPRLSIENLRFDEPSFTAISILRANESVRISGVRVTGVQSYLFPPFNGRFRDGISVSSAIAAIGGEIVIVDNVLDGGSYTATDTSLLVNAGIALTGAAPGAVNQPFTARVTIADNRLLNWSGSAVLATGIHGATIERNKIDPGAFANQVAGCAQPNGVGAANGISLASVSDSLVRDNVVSLVPALTGTGESPQCTAGILLVGAVAGPADGNIFHRNRIRGTGSYAIVVGSASGSTEIDNVFALDRLGNFVPQTATLFLGAGATDNAFIGEFATIEGNAAGNLILGR